MLTVTLQPFPVLHTKRLTLRAVTKQASKGKGFMNEALRAVINYGFTSIKLHSIEANVNPDNQASIKLLEKNGFVREGYHKENYFFDGKFLDSAIYSLLTPKNLEQSIKFVS